MWSKTYFLEDHCPRVENETAQPLCAIFSRGSSLNGSFQLVPYLLCRHHSYPTTNAPSESVFRLGMNEKQAVALPSKLY
eukprot:scaffold3641_cov120-Cylindrotheca_fusiformis.AAC.4